MKALTLHQPWASLIALGVKTIETRSWATSYRGPLAIHAGKTGWSLAEAPEAWEGLGAAVGVSGYDAWHNTACAPDYVDCDLPCWPFGAIVATCLLVDCVPITDWARDGSPTIAHTRPPLPGGGYGERLWRDDGRACWPIDDQLPYGDFTAGRYAWLLDDIVPLAEPVSARGRQGLWEWAA